jgi:hypothetical protein
MIRMTDENRCPICRGWHDNTCIYENKPCPNIPILSEMPKESPVKRGFGSVPIFEIDITRSHPIICLLDMDKCNECYEASLKRERATFAALSCLFGIMRSYKEETEGKS